MKKSLIALAVLAASGVASAQSSVTIYGKADIGVARSIVSSITEELNGAVAVSVDRGTRVEIRFPADTGARAEQRAFA